MRTTSTDGAEGRLAQAVLIGATLGVSWLAMQIVHEAGHVGAALLSGGQVRDVVLHPFQFSRTDVAPNPAPLIVAWAGPLLGCVIPCAAWGITGGFKARTAYLFRFFAGFCLIANGLYLASGWLAGVGDAADILRQADGSYLPAGFGLIVTPIGFAIWHRLGPSFGLGAARGHVIRRHAWGMLVLFLGLVVAELIWSRS